MSDPHAAANVLNEKPERAVTWTTVNAGEAAFPGVPTPLSWTWAWWPTEYGTRGAFASIGSFPPSFAHPPTVLHERVLTIHQGHVAVNLDIFRAFADGVPGGTGDDVERAYFGSVRPGINAVPRRRRYPVVTARMPITAISSRLAVRRAAAPTDRWWRAAVAEPDPDPATARALLLESQRRYADIARPHVVVGIVTQGLYDQVRQLCRQAGMADQAGALVPGGTEEAGWLAELWEVAHGRGTIEEFVLRHGYHGPLEGELSSPTWRIDPRPLTNLLSSYARNAESPAAAAALRERDRLATRAGLLAALPAPRRAAARALLAAARAYMPLRESGRATFLRTYDVARHATRAIGRHLVADGLLDDEADVFYLTLDELTSARTPNDARSLVPARRGLREHYQTISLPNLWTGVPTPSIVIEDESEPGLSEPFTGQGVSAGIAEGTVRVILDPTDSDDINEGDVLVCRATDPSWATLFYLASAVIMDLGGDMSHGAIVARELGLPAVVNTRDGTRRLRNGDHVRVDGSAGTVTPMPTGHGAALSARDRDVQRTDRSRSE